MPFPATTLDGPNRQHLGVTEASVRQMEPHPRAVVARGVAPGVVLVGQAGDGRGLDHAPVEDDESSAALG